MRTLIIALLLFPISSICFGQYPKGSCLPDAPFAKRLAHLIVSEHFDYSRDLKDYVFTVKETKEEFKITMHLNCKPIHQCKVRTYLVRINRKDCGVLEFGLMM